MPSADSVKLNVPRPVSSDHVPLSVFPLRVPEILPLLAYVPLTLTPVWTSTMVPPRSVFQVPVKLAVPGPLPEMEPLSETGEPVIGWPPDVIARVPVCVVGAALDGRKRTYTVTELWAETFTLAVAVNVPVMLVDREKGAAVMSEAAPAPVPELVMVTGCGEPA